MNHRAKFDAANLILGGEIRNRTKTQKIEMWAIRDALPLEAARAPSPSACQVSAQSSDARLNYCNFKLKLNLKLKTNLYSAIKYGDSEALDGGSSQRGSQRRCGHLIFSPRAQRTLVVRANIRA